MLSLGVLVRRDSDAERNDPVKTMEFRCHIVAFVHDISTTFNISAWHTGRRASFGGYAIARILDEENLEGKRNQGKRNVRTLTRRCS